MAVVYEEDLHKFIGSNKTAGDIVLALRNRHNDRMEVNLNEVELGRSGRRADFYTMRASWTKPMPTCYEIKVSVQDFKNDKKWHLYLPYCERFYFACPAGLLQPEQIDERAGLVWVDDKGYVSLKKNSPNRKLEEKHKNAMMQRILYRYMFKHGDLIQPHEDRLD